MNLIDDVETSISIRSKPFQRPFLFATILNENVRMLYDTGADISCVNEEVFRRIPIDQRPRKSDESFPRQFRSAGGQNLQVKGKYNLPVMLGRKTVHHPFYVIKNLSEPAIVGIDFIQQHKLTYCPDKRSFSWNGGTSWYTGTMKLCAAEIIPPLTVAQVRVSLLTEGGCLPGPETPCIANIAVVNNPVLMGGPCLVTPNNIGQAVVQIHNCSPVEIALERGDLLGYIENVLDCEMRQLNPSYINAVAEEQMKARIPPPLPPEKKKFIIENATLNVPEEYRQRYLDILLKNHEVISAHKYDLGRTETLLHEISLKTEEPVYVKQFKIPDAHREEVEKHVAEWLKLGVVQPARSKFNSPIFVVAKKNGGIRLVQDFRALNAQTHMDKYSMKDVSECIGEIGRSGSTIFSTLDLTSGFWQMLLHPKSRPYTAFTVSGQGQFEWVTSPMGLLGCPASFQRLMETVVSGLLNIIVYIDDLLAHACSHEEHLLQIDQLLHRLITHGIKINLQKCVFGSKDVSYLGFRLTEEGIKPGSDKLRAVAAAGPPANVHEVRQFLGLCNFFRTHVRNFAQISAPLTKLTRKDCGWKSGSLPPDSLKAFRELQTCLCSEPVVDYPRRDRPYALITDAALGDDKNPGGLGAILTQVKQNGEHCVIAYASRKLQKHEKNYTPFLLEMQAAIWGMEHFATHLKGRHFTLFTDHKPLEKLGKVHTRTLNRLQEAMNTYDFEIIYKKGSEMPADFLSRNVIDAISWDHQQLQQEQDRDPLIKALKGYLLNRELPADQKCQNVVRNFANDCFVENDIVWRRIKRQFEPSRVVIFLPQALVTDVLQEAHGHLLTGHDGVYKTKERIFQCYYWPGMDSSINDHLKSCHKCQVRRVDHRPPPALLTPLPQPTEPNMRIHADLFGPLRISGRQKCYILSITDAFTKYVELVSLPNKEAPTVTEAIFNRWICRYSVPIEIVTDQGKEFCNELSNELYKLLQTSHLHTSSRHPACNSQAEVGNKTIAKYLASFVSDDTLDWEQYLAPLMFCYNTSFHRSIKTTPYFLTYGQEPRLPSFPAPDLRRKFYGESTSAELHQRLLYARDVARRNNENATDKSEEYFNKTAEPHKYQLQQLVLLDEHSFLHKNTKLAPKWSGPHRIIRLKGSCNAELLLKNGKHLLIHVNRLKPYLTPQQSDVRFDESILMPDQRQDLTEVVTQNQPPTTPVIPQPMNEEDVDERFPTLPLLAPPAPPLPPLPPLPPAPDIATPDLGLPQPPAAKRRGRPPKRMTSAPPPSSTYQLRSRTLSQPIESSSTLSSHLEDKRPVLLVPQFSRSSPLMPPQPSPPPPQGGGNDEENTPNVEAIEDQWTLVIKKKKKNRQCWNKKQKQNFSQTGDIYNEPAYKNFRYQEHENNEDHLQEQEQDDNDVLNNNENEAEEIQLEAPSNSSSEDEVDSSSEEEEQTTPERSRTGPKSILKPMVTNQPTPKPRHLDRLRLTNSQLQEFKTSSPPLPTRNELQQKFENLPRQSRKELQQDFDYIPSRTRSQSAAPDISPLPRIPLERKVKAKKTVKFVLNFS